MTGTEKVLVIEDEEVTLLAMVQMIQTAGYNATTATDAAEAITAFELESPDLMLVDINLPGETFGQQMDGLAVIDWLNYRHPDHLLNYIIVSGDDPLKHKGRPAALGALSYIQKPFQMDLLLADIRRALGESLDLASH